MKIKSITYGAAALVNLKNYENFKTSVEVTVDFEEGDTEQEVIEYARKLVNNEIRNQYKEIKSKIK